MTKKQKKVKIKNKFDICYKTNINENPDDSEFIWQINQGWLELEDQKLGWHTIDSKSLLLNIICRLKEFEHLKWKEIRKKTGCHPMHPSKLCKYAQKVWEKYNLEEFEDQLFQIRITSANRIFGIVEKNVFYLLWNDLEHEAYPIDIKDNKN